VSPSDPGGVTLVSLWDPLLPPGAESRGPKAVTFVTGNPKKSYFAS
jgi:hypothetical protein